MTIYEASISFFSPDPVSPAPITLTTRQGDWFHRAVPVTNTSNGVAAEIKVTGVRSGETWNPIMNKVGLARVPKAAETFTYDFDGNMTGDSLWTYQWDGENRLIRVTSKLLTGDHAYRDETFTYDYANRMTRQQVSGWEPYLVPNTTETWVWIQVQYRRYFVWQGWNIVAELEERKPANGDFTGVATLLRRNVWGLDLSGSLQGAGGVGGLLAVQNHATDLNGQLSSATTTPVYDGNGNILAYHNLINGVKVADFAYGPFGEPLKAYGEAAKNHPFRFSTKYTDDETGIVLYQLRPYRPDLGRWLQKDRIGERGGVNLYGMVRNNAIVNIDILGERLAESLQEFANQFKCHCGFEIFKSLQGAVEDMEKLLDSDNYEGIEDMKAKLRDMGSETVGLEGEGVVGAGKTLNKCMQDFINAAEKWPDFNGKKENKEHPNLLAGSANPDHELAKLWLEAELKRIRNLTSRVREFLALSVEKCFCLGEYTGKFK